MNVQYESHGSAASSIASKPPRREAQLPTEASAVPLCTAAQGSAHAARGTKQMFNKPCLAAQCWVEMTRMTGSNVGQNCIEPGVFYYQFSFSVVSSDLFQNYFSSRIRWQI